MISYTPTIFLTCLCGLVRIAFLTLTERKILRYSQLRKGPNKPSLIGLLTPGSDAIKLLSKEIFSTTFTNKPLFYASPTLLLLIALILWITLPITKPSLIPKYGIIVFLCLSSIRVYSTLAARWASNSKYALLGSTRNIAQTISYEVRIAFIIINIFILLPSLSLYSPPKLSYTPIALLNLTTSLIWLSTIIAELNRAPFDLIEGERELVSGFNTEYGRGLFTLIFIAEYINILFISGISIIILITSPLYSLQPLLLISISSISVLIILSRTTYPRIRYNTLISLNWKIFLPFIISTIILIINLPQI